MVPNIPKRSQMVPYMGISKTHKFLKCVCVSRNNLFVRLPARPPGVYMGTYGVYIGYIWVTYGGKYGYIWVYMGIYGGKYGYIWVYMGIYGYIWVHMDICGYIWIYRGIYGYIKLMHGYIWVYIGMIGPLKLIFGWGWGPNSHLKSVFGIFDSQNMVEAGFLVVTIDTRGMAGHFDAVRDSLAFFVFPLYDLHLFASRPRQTPTVGYNATGPAFFLSANMPEQIAFWVWPPWATQNGDMRVFGSGGPEKWFFWPYSAPLRPNRRSYGKYVDTYGKLS